MGNSFKRVFCIRLQENKSSTFCFGPSLGLVVGKNLHDDLLGGHRTQFGGAKSPF